MDLSKLQNGSDIRGVAIENADYKVNLSEEVVKKITIGFCLWIKKNLKKERPIISVGIDSRITGPELKRFIIDAAYSFGAEVLDCGMATTPAMYMSTVMDDYDADGAIMVTASHMPYFYNGMKFFTKKSGLNKEDLSEIIELSEKIVLDESCKNEQIIENKNINIKKKDLIDAYSKIIRKKILEKTDSNKDKPFLGMKIIVDAGNGAGGFFAEKILKKLGADIEGSQFLNPDGNFPNHIPNPENKEAMESISKAVIKNKADLGVIFDTDVDRAAIVSSDGKNINKNALIGVISSIILEKYPNTYIVTDSVTSKGLTEFIKLKGGIHHRFKRGYRNVINEAIRLNEIGKETHLAIETSGHAAIKENYFLDDGSYLIAEILIKAANMQKSGRKIIELIKDLKEPEEEMEKRINIKRKDFKKYAERIILELEEYCSKISGWSIVEPNFEGIRVNCSGEKQNGMFLLRVSLHEPLLALNIESDISGGTKEIYKELEKFLKKYDLEI